MPLERISIENYLCFADRQELELRPITVVLGKNNSGKSALVRAPLVLATGIRNDSPAPLDLPQLGADHPDFVDLVHGRLKHGSVTVGLEFRDAAGRSLGLSATIQNVDEWHTQVVAQWSLLDGNSTTTLQWGDPTDAYDPVQPYRVTAPDGTESHVSTDFTGLFPAGTTGSPGIDPSNIAVQKQRMRDELDLIRHLGPYRTRPRRQDPLPARPPRDDESGASATAHLIYDHIHRNGVLIAKVNELLSAHLPGWDVDVIPRYEGHAVGLRSTRERSLWVSITDAGTGVAQTLPILVRRALDEIEPPSRDVLEIIEEPELNLHPSAQADLADLYIQAAKNTRVHFLIETHSETFLLRLRRRIAEERLDPEILGLYFVESIGNSATAKRIDVDGYGNVDYWPRGIFAEDFEETRAMSAAQLKLDRRNADAD